MSTKNQEEEPTSEALREMEEMMGYEKQDEDSEERNEESMRSLSERGVQRRFVVTAEETPFDISYHPGRVLFYSPPRQRQRWGDSQVLPRTNWGDIFFDLFYVAATYNVSLILVLDPTFEGLLYAAGTFLPVMGIWLTKLFYDARFVFEDDISHRIGISASLVVLALAVLHIRPVEFLSNPKEHESMFVFGLVLVVIDLMQIGFYAEVFFLGVGQKKVLRAISRDTMLWTLLPTSFYLAATIVAGLDYFGEANDSAKRYLAEADASYVDEGTSLYTNHIPIWLILAGYLAALAHRSIMVICCFPGGGRHKEM